MSETREKNITDGRAQDAHAITLPPHEAPPPLVVQDLACRRGERLILDGVSFSVEPGRALILRAPNGAGKTTLLRAIARLTPPVRGTVSPDPEAMTWFGHSDGVKAQLTVAENLRFWAAVHGTRNIAPALAAFRLEELADRPAAYLSAGQRRRLGLARLLVAGRPIWLLDEPTVSLDAATVATFAEVVKAHLAAGGLALIATHIPLGLAEEDVLDVTPFRARESVEHAHDPFLDAGFGTMPEDLEEAGQ